MLKREIDYGLEIEFRLAPPERAKSALRSSVYQMTPDELTGLERDIGEVVNDTTKSIEQQAGQSVYEMVAQQVAERVADGRISIEIVREYVSRLPEWTDRAELVRFLQVHFPAEKFEPVKFKKAGHGAYYNAAVAEYEQIEARVEHLEWNAETAKERIELLLLRAELEAAEDKWSGDGAVETRLREQRIEAVMWFLEKLLRPLSAIAKGAATVPMMKRGAFDTPVTGFTALLDYLSF